MARTGIWHRVRDLVAGLSGRECPERPDALPVQRRQRRDRVKRVLRDAAPAWSDGPERCDACSRELLVGEAARIMARGEQLSVVCPLCAMELVDKGYQPVTSMDEVSIPIETVTIAESGDSCKK